MEQIKPRYEFRTFALNLGLVETKMRELGGMPQIRESDEIYIVSAQNDVNNTKIRDGKLDIKSHVETKHGLEQWSPKMKGAFPLTQKVILDELLPAFGMELTSLEYIEYNLELFLEKIIFPQPYLVAARVFKRRFGFMINDCICETADVYVNGAFIRTACVESTEPEKILETINDTHLDGFENINYLKAIKRITGLIPLNTLIY